MILMFGSWKKRFLKLVDIIFKDRVYTDLRIKELEKKIEELEINLSRYDYIPKINITEFEFYRRLNERYEKPMRISYDCEEILNKYKKEKE